MQNVVFMYIVVSTVTVSSNAAEHQTFSHPAQTFKIIYGNNKSSVAAGCVCVFARLLAVFVNNSWSVHEFVRPSRTLHDSPTKNPVVRVCAKAGQGGQIDHDHHQNVVFRCDADDQLLT
jgi:hypothetical protein